MCLQGVVGLFRDCPWILRWRCLRVFFSARTHILVLNFGVCQFLVAVPRLHGCEMLVPRPGTGPAFPALRSRFLAPAPPGGAPVCALAVCAGSVLCEALPLQGRRGVFLTYANIIQLEMGSLWSVVS